jgi:DNA modification methylase
MGMITDSEKQKIREKLSNDIVIEKKHIADLTPAAYNPRKISEKELENLTRSMSTFSLVELIVWNKQTGNVVSGHQRLKVLQAYEVEETQVVVVDLPLAKEKALNIALNRIGGVFDLVKLKEVIIDIDTGEFDIRVTGYDYDELRDLIDYQREDILSLDNDDEVPEAPEEPITQLGDVWIMGQHRLCCGDCTDSKDLGRLMEKEKADMIFTDPPYNVNYEDTFGRKILNDNIKDLNGFLATIYRHLFAIAGDRTAAYVCYAEVNVIPFLTCATEAKWEYRNTLIWLKDVPAMNFGHYTWKYEPILYLAKGAPKFYGTKNHANVFDVPSFNSFAGRKDDQGNRVNRSLHPNQKPVELITKALVNSSKRDQIVADLFGGSGSTLIACEKSGRQAQLMELDPIYCDVIVKRWENYTGNKARRIHAGKKAKKG